jgi:hypothetical protein
LGSSELGWLFGISEGTGRSFGIDESANRGFVVEVQPESKAGMNINAEANNMRLRCLRSAS